MSEKVPFFSTFIRLWYDAWNMKNFERVQEIRRDLIRFYPLQWNRFMTCMFPQLFPCAYAIELSLRDVSEEQIPSMDEAIEFLTHADSFHGYRLDPSGFLTNAEWLRKRGLLK